MMLIVVSMLLFEQWQVAFPHFPPILGGTRPYVLWGGTPGNGVRDENDIT